MSISVTDVKSLFKSYITEPSLDSILKCSTMLVRSLIPQGSIRLFPSRLEKTIDYTGPHSAEMETMYNMAGAPQDVLVVIMTWNFVIRMARCVQLFQVKDPRTWLVHSCSMVKEGANVLEQKILRNGITNLKFKLLYQLAGSKFKVMTHDQGQTYVKTIRLFKAYVKGVK